LPRNQLDLGVDALGGAVATGEGKHSAGVRWVTKSGEVSEPGRRTLPFPSGGDTTEQEQVVVTTYDTDGTYEDGISVEVRGPVPATCNTVAFSATCEAEAPTGGASSPTGSADAPGDNALAPDEPAFRRRS
jgi:eukaryotic-like serine/threonine-protein kinase